MPTESPPGGEGTPIGANITVEMQTPVIELTQLVKIALTQVNEMNSKGCQHQQTSIRLQFRTEHAESARKAPINRDIAYQGVKAHKPIYGMWSQVRSHQSRH